MSCAGVELNVRVDPHASILVAKFAEQFPTKMRQNQSLAVAHAVVIAIQGRKLQTRRRHQRQRHRGTCVLGPHP